MLMLQNEELEKLENHAKIAVQTKPELFLRLCAINYLNALVKQKDYKKVVHYGMIKPKVFYLAKNLVSNNKLNLCDDMYVKLSEDCLYIRCYGLQFGFHNINAKALEEEFPQLCNEEGQWDGIRLQPLGETLYELAKEVVEQDLGEDVVKDRIKTIVEQDVHSQN